MLLRSSALRSGSAANSASAASMPARIYCASASLSTSNREHEAIPPLGLGKGVNVNTDISDTSQSGTFTTASGDTPKM